MKRSTRLILGSIPLLVIAVVLVFLMQSREAADTNTNTEVPQGETVTTNSSTNTEDQKRELTQDELQRGDITRTATIFGEQFGTYRGSFSAVNLHALESIITSSLQSQLESSITPSTSDVEVTTQVLSVEIATLTLNQSSVVLVSTLRSTENADGSAEVVSQDLALEFVYTDGEWKVRSAQWKEPEAADLPS